MREHQIRENVMWEVPVRITHRRTKLETGDFRKKNTVAESDRRLKGNMPDPGWYREPERHAPGNRFPAVDCELRRLRRENSFLR